jgi:addiction module RelB/DinJ family antitoxin
MMMNATIQIRTDADIKVQADSIFKQMGITLSDGLNMFLRQVVMRRGMPFTPEVVEPKAEEPTEKKATAKMSRAELFQQVQELKKGMKPVTTAEILEWTKEGRR